MPTCIASADSSGTSLRHPPMIARPFFSRRKSVWIRPRVVYTARRRSLLAALGPTNVFGGGLGIALLAVFAERHGLTKLNVEGIFVRAVLFFSPRRRALFVVAATDLRGRPSRSLLAAKSSPSAPQPVAPSASSRADRAALATSGRCDFAGSPLGRQVLDQRLLGHLAPARATCCFRASSAPDLRRLSTHRRADCVVDRPESRQVLLVVGSRLPRSPRRPGLLARLQRAAEVLAPSCAQ